VSLPLEHDILDEVDRELTRAQEVFPAMRSPHEASAVVREEYEEFWDEVRLKTGTRAGMRKELIQLAAMAVRAIEDLGL
jgi:hypothetical protein